MCSENDISFFCFSGKKNNKSRTGGLAKLVKVCVEEGVKGGVEEGVKGGVEEGSKLCVTSSIYCNH